jgi:hydrogenase-1 operon protein HyaF
MAKLEDIPVRQIGAGMRHNALPILHEIRHALTRLAETGETTSIDLRAIPFGPGDEERLLQTLGEGEVRAQVEALGTTRIWESGYAGVWVVDYYNTEGERIAFQIEVTDLPQILRSDREDIARAAAALAEDLQGLNS